jgi:hypothetical protein
LFENTNLHGRVLTWPRWQEVQGLPIKYQNMFKTMQL